MARSDSSDAIRITTAGSGPAADLARRQRRYLISMSFRALCFVGAVIAGANHVNWLWPILILLALVLPYVAVVMANASDSRETTMGLVGGMSPHKELAPEDEPGETEGTDGA
ncbi:DUF3099 domain-containing protein [Nocardioides montaniterrae]